MKNQEDLFPADKCYIFDELKHCYCVRYEKVRIPSREELLALWKDQKILYPIIFCFIQSILLKGVV
jgi:hypothetical protein